MRITQHRDANYVDLSFDVDLGFANGITGTNTQFAISLPFRSDKTFMDSAIFVIRDPEDILPCGRAQFTPVYFVHYGEKSGWGATVANIDAVLLRPDGLFLVAAENLRVRQGMKGCAGCSEPSRAAHLSRRSVSGGNSS